MPLLIVVISVILLLLFDDAGCVCDSLKVSVSEIGNEKLNPWKRNIWIVDERKYGVDTI